MDNLKIPSIDWRASFKCYLTPEMRECVQKSRGDSPIPATALMCFLEGLLLEEGLLDDRNALKSYRDGVRHYLDPLCALRLAHIYGNPKGLNISPSKKSKNIKEEMPTRDSALSFAYLTIADAYYDVLSPTPIGFKFDDILNQVSNEPEQRIKLGVQQIERYRNMIFFASEVQPSGPSAGLMKEKAKKQWDSLVSSRIDEVKCFLIFKYSQNDEDSDKAHEGLVNCISEVAHQTERERRWQLLVRLVNTQTHNTKKFVHNVVEHSRLQTLPEFARLETDAEAFVCLNVYHELMSQFVSLFTETLTLLKTLSVQSKIMMPNREEPQLIRLQQYLKNTIQLLYDKRKIITIKKHLSFVIRIHSEFLSKGMATKRDIVQAIRVLEEERTVKKEKHTHLAFFYYKKAKLLLKLPEGTDLAEEATKPKINKLINDAKELFEERETSTDPVIQLVAQYYLGRISHLQQLPRARTNKYFEECVKIVESDYISIAITFQFEFLRAKSLAIMEAIARPYQVEDLLNKQQQEAYQEQPHFSRCNSLRSKVSLASQNQKNFDFFHPGIFETTKFIGKGLVGSTTVAKVKRKLEVDSGWSLKSFFQLFNEEKKTQEPMMEKFSRNANKYGKTSAEDLELQQESLKLWLLQFKRSKEVAIKQIPFNANSYFDVVLRRLLRMHKYSEYLNGLLQVQGLCIRQINQHAFELWMVYPYLEHNLYAIIKQNILKTQTAVLGFALILAESLHNMHELGICHGSIKPNNIFYDPETNTAKISDWEFGSISPSNSMQASSVHSIKGSPSKYQMNSPNKQNSQFTTPQRMNDSRLTPSKSSRAQDQDEANIDDDESQEKVSLFGDCYTAPELITWRKIKVKETNNEKEAAYGLYGDIWALGMCFFFLFSGIDPRVLGVRGEIDMREHVQRINNARVQDLIIQMVKADPFKRLSSSKIRDILISECLRKKTGFGEIVITDSASSSSNRDDENN